MTYKIDILLSVYKLWASVYKQLAGLGSAFPRVMMERYPEILSISEWDCGYNGIYRTFEFESETHYHWFLLKQ